MKLYKKLMPAALALLTLGGFTSCDEKDTLDGADAVYLEIDPSEIVLSLGDTVKISASVTNVSGRTIKTDVKWSIDREEGQPEIVKLLGDTAIISVEGAVGKSTNLRATLPNGKYALASVSVVANTPQAVMPVDTGGVYAPVRTSYNIPHDSVVFAITPALLLRDYTPTYVIEGEGIEEYAAQPMYIDYQKGTVAIHYGVGRKSGQGTISVTIGEGATAQTGKCTVRMDAPIEGATFYGPDYAGMPYLETRPALNTLRQWYATTYNRNLDFNSYDTCRVAVNVLTGAEIDILEAYKVCKWECVEGSSVMVVGMYNEYIENNGFNAVLVVASGISKGETVFQYTTPCDTLAATFKVFDLKNDFPVEEITVDNEDLSLFSGQTGLLTVGVLPLSSFGYHKPTFEVADPSIISIGKYIGNQVPITGLKPGDTYVTLRSNGCTKTIHVTVIEGVRSVLWENGDTKLFAGESTEWTVNVVTPSGSANQFPVEWTVTDDNIASVTPKEGAETTAGVVKALAAGSTDIRAKVLDQRSDARTLTVLPAPEATMTFKSAENVDAFGDGKDFVVNIERAEGSAFSFIVLTLKDVYEGENFATFNVGEGSTVEIDGRAVNLVSGSLTLSAVAGKSDVATISGTVTYEIAGLGTFKFTLDNLEAVVY